MAERTELWSLESADSSEDSRAWLSLAPLLLNLRKAADGIPDWIFERMRNGVVLMERCLETKEVDGDDAARMAARRM
jgi:hypothetical protein